MPFCLFFCISINLFMCLSFCLCVHLSICQVVYMPNCSSIYVFSCLHICFYLYVYIKYVHSFVLSVFCHSVILAFCLSDFVSVYSYKQSYFLMSSCFSFHLPGELFSNLNYASSVYLSVCMFVSSSSSPLPLHPSLALTLPSSSSQTSPTSWPCARTWAPAGRKTEKEKYVIITHLELSIRIIKIWLKGWIFVVEKVSFFNGFLKSLKVRVK